MAPSIMLDNMPSQTEIEQTVNKEPHAAKDLISSAADLAMANDFIKHMETRNELANAVKQPPTERVRNTPSQINFDVLSRFQSLN